MSWPQPLPTLQPGRVVRTPAKGLRSPSPAVGPPLLIPLYFQYQIIMTMIVRKDWVVSQGVHLARGRGVESVPVNGPRRPALCPTYFCGTPAVAALSLSGRALLGGCQDPGGHCTPPAKDHTHGVHWGAFAEPPSENS